MKLSVLGIAIFLMTGPVVVADELDDAYQGLQDAVAKKDTAQVKKLAVQTCELARKLEAAPVPTSAIEKEDWPNRLKYAKEAEWNIQKGLTKMVFLLRQFKCCIPILRHHLE